MSENNMELWDKLKTPPDSALNPIKGGRLKGMTDISPQWRYMALTENLGVCGVGWKYEIDKLWNEPGSDGQIMCFALVKLFIMHDSNWSDPIPGIGGSMLIEKETKGLHTSDEGYKMAVTDALSVACKVIGVGSDIYMGNMDGSKYRNQKKNPKCPKCGKDEFVFIDKNKPGWFYCWKKPDKDKHGCGNKFAGKEEKERTEGSKDSDTMWLNEVNSCTTLKILDNMVKTCHVDMARECTEEGFKNVKLEVEKKRAFFKTPQ